MRYGNEFLLPPCNELFNATEDWKHTDSIEQWYKVRDTVPYGIDSFRYHYNNYGFRCDDFESWEKHPFRIAFAGCSHTEGLGLPIEEIWPKLFLKKASEKLGVELPFWSIARAGTGTDHMVRSLYHYGDLLRPQVIISYMPTYHRRERWHDDMYIPGQGTEIGKDAKKGYHFMEDRFVVYQTEKNMAFIDMMLKKWDGLLLYVIPDWNTTSDIESLTQIKQLEGDHFFEDFFMDYARDGQHAGPKANALFAEKMFNASWPIIEKRLRKT